MNYETIRELLLKEKALSIEDAMSILHCWMEDRETYDKLLNEGSAVALQVYENYSAENGCHKFAPSDVHVLSPHFAKLFFNLKDDMITALFATAINQLTFSENETGDVYAWPYLTMDCIRNLDGEFVLHVIEDMHFVFDFAADKEADLYDCLYHKIYDIYNHEGLLAINSFNLSPKWLQKKNGLDMAALMYEYFMVNHNFGNNVSDAMFRKLFIAYLYRTTRKMEQAYQQYIIQSN